MEVGDIFDAEPKSILEFLVTGQGLYVPAYQRPYTWDKDNIVRLFDDISQGLDYFLGSDDAITFIGTIIGIKDTNYHAVQPQVVGEMPAGVNLVIDGQQRLTTILILNTLLKEALEIRVKKFSSYGEDERFEWIYGRSMMLIQNLLKTYKMDQGIGEEFYQFYPKMIRSIDDQWSKKSRNAKYTSPIARYLSTTIRNDFSKETLGKEFDYGKNLDDSLEAQTDKDPHEVINRNIKVIKSLIKKAVCENNHPEIKYPSVNDLLSSNQVMTHLFDGAMPESVRNYLLSNSDDTDYNKFVELFHLNVFSQFLLNRLAMTVVTAKNEDYAFDMFESLNTTGEPLTAFETFKPKIIQSESVANYEGSTSEAHVQKIERLLGQGSNAQARQRATTDLLVPFALLFDGEKLSRHLSKQRRYLRDRYDNMSLEEGKEFVRTLAHMAEFMEKFWPLDSKRRPEYKVDDSISKEDRELSHLSLEFLREQKHSVSQPLLARFFSARKVATDNEERKSADLDLVSVIKATAAFFFLWRTAHSNTAGIDTLHRKLMKDGLDSISLDPVCVSHQAVLSSDSIKRAYKEFLEGAGIAQKDKWVSKVISLPQYEKKSLVKFFILACSHDASEDNAELGLLVKGKKNVSNQLNVDHWLRSLDYEIEHVAPRSNSSGAWDTNIYDEPQIVDGIGNLALVPKLENIVLSDRSWGEKKSIYKALSAETEDTFDEAIQGLSELNLASRSQEILENSEYLNQVRVISQRDVEWDAEFIKKRSKRMAEIAWDNIASWLD